jgi:hypothetical protein
MQRQGPRRRRCAGVGQLFGTPRSAHLITRERLLTSWSEKFECRLEPLGARASQDLKPTE